MRYNCQELFCSEVRACCGRLVADKAEAATVREIVEACLQRSARSRTSKPNSIARATSTSDGRRRRDVRIMCRGSDTSMSAFRRSSAQIGGIARPLPDRQSLVSRNCQKGTVTSPGKLRFLWLPSGQQDKEKQVRRLRSVIAQIEVGDGKIRVFSDKTALAAATNAENVSAPNVRGFLRGWRTGVCRLS